MSIALFIKAKGKLTPADAEAEAQLEAVKEGGRVMVTMRSPRNEAMSRLFFAVLRVVVDNSDHWPSVEAFRKALLIRAGHFDMVVTLDGQIVPQARSMSAAELDQIKFKRLFDRCMHIICTEEIPGMDPAVLVNEVMPMLGGGPRNE